MFLGNNLATVSSRATRTLDLQKEVFKRSTTPPRTLADKE